MLRIKADANQLFGAGECQRALDGWTAALQVYGDRYGSPEQRFEKGKLHSNKAEAALKDAELWQDGFVDAGDIRNIMNVMADQRKMQIPEEEGA